jgi:hypothetical protein
LRNLLEPIHILLQLKVLVLEGLDVLDLMFEFTLRVVTSPPLGFKLLPKIDGLVLEMVDLLLFVRQLGVPHGKGFSLRCLLLLK